MKPKITVITETPLVINIQKNGRSVSLASALGVLKKAYPSISSEQWDIVNIRSAHSTKVRLK